jgi:hypothetical protein
MQWRIYQWDNRDGIRNIQAFSEKLETMDLRGAVVILEEI